MIRPISPGTGPVNAEIKVPGSKSITNRALICAALANGESLLRNASDSDDTALMANGLNQLGILVRKIGEGLSVEGKGGRVYAPRFPIPVGNAGTTLRFLLGIGAVSDGPVTFEGGGRMSERPIQPLLDGLRDLGVECEAFDFASRYGVRGGSFRGGRVKVRADISSQFLSSILMVAPYAQTDVRLQPAGATVSGPYVSMTLEVMKKFGSDVVVEPDGSLFVRAGSRYRATTFDVEPDFSSAAIFFCAVAITGGEVRIRHIAKGSIQGDTEILDILQSLGARVRNEDGYTVLSCNGAGSFSGIDVNMVDTPDLVPALVSVLLFANSPSRIGNVEHLHFKESDRLNVLCSELQKIGAKIRLIQDGLEIEPAALTGAKLNPHDDHRLAMSFGIIGLKVPGISIENPDCVRKSFPRFWAELERLEGKPRA